jgi:hypothetical protein
MTQLKLNWHSSRYNSMQIVPHVGGSAPDKLGALVSGVAAHSDCGAAIGGTSAHNNQGTPSGESAHFATCNHII